MNREALSRIILLVIVLLISVLFISMIRHFLMALLLAAIFSGLAHPLYARVERAFKGKRSLASFVTLALVVLFIIVPLAGILGIVVRQAFHISRSVQPWITDMASRPSALDGWLRSLPFYDRLQEYGDVLLQKGAQLVNAVSTALFERAGAATVSTVQFFFLFFVFMYAMFFFLRDGRGILDKMIYYLPLAETDTHRLLGKFTSVTRAMLKGTFVIGVIQGGLAGLAFWVIGIESALFWGVIMTVLSVIPGLGTAFVWVPTVVILAAMGHFAKAIGLCLWCALVVGSVDNILRPRLVGRDVKMPTILVFLGTVGGISLFGIAGFIIGPIVAALFITIWEIYGETFREHLSERR